MRISQRGVPVSLQLDEVGKQALSRAGVQPEETLSACIVDEDEHGLWMKISRAGQPYWLMVRWPSIQSVEVPAPATSKGK
jgi:hypothetical protein